MTERIENRRSSSEISVGSDTERTNTVSSVTSVRNSTFQLPSFKSPFSGKRRTNIR